MSKDSERWPMSPERENRHMSDFNSIELDTAGNDLFC